MARHKSMRTYIVLSILFILLLVLYLFFSSKEEFAVQTAPLDTTPPGSKKISIYLFSKNNTITLVPTPYGTTTDPTVSAKYLSNTCTLTFTNPTYSIYDYTISGYNEVVNAKTNPDKCTTVIVDSTQGNKAYGWCLGEFSQTGQALLYDSKNNVKNRPSTKVATLTSKSPSTSPYTIKGINTLAYNSARLHPVGITDSGKAISNANIRIDLSVIVSK